MAISLTAKTGARCAAILLGVALVFAAPALAQQTSDVIIQDYHFQPAEVRINVGDSVRWSNHEKRTSHSIVLPVELGGESQRFFPGESWTQQFDAPGRYHYQCGPHPEMLGVVVVTPP